MAKPTISNLNIHGVSRIVVKWDGENKCYDVELQGTDNPVMGYRFDTLKLTVWGDDDENPPHLEVESAHETSVETRAAIRTEEDRPTMPPFRDEDGHDGSD